METNNQKRKEKKMKKLLLIGVLMSMVGCSNFKVGECVYLGNEFFHIVKVSGNTLELVNLAKGNLDVVINAPYLDKADCAIAHEYIESKKARK
jgi:fructose-1,6-bisphosphatase/inositol monophosphatase family enzyme